MAVLVLGLVRFVGKVVRQLFKRYTRSNDRGSLVKKSLFYISFLFMVVGCADSHNLQVSELTSNVKVLSTDSIYIAVSENGQYGSKNYIGSGDMLTQSIKASLMTKLDNVVVAKEHQTYSEALNYAKQNKFDYLVYPTILHWEDRATEWSGIPDKLQVKISVTRISDSTIIKSAVINGKSGIFTFGGDHPQDLLPEAVNDYWQGIL